MMRLNIDGKECTAYPGQTVLEVARANHIEIPTLCHDERVKTYGACGLCVVETEGSPRLLRACATEVTPNMIVFTDTPRIRASRKMTLELLLSDHIGDCRPPCVLACPAHTDCQGYVGLIANGQFQEAVALIKEQLPLPASIGLVCPHPCEDACRRQMVEEPVSIAALKYFVGQYDLDAGHPFMPEIKAATGKKVAVAGSGPAGLTAAYFLAVEGHEVTVYDAMPHNGGMLRYGIPEYRLPKDILDKEIDLIARMGVKFINSVRVGTDVSLDYLRDNYDAIFLGIGAWKSSGMRVNGEDIPGVMGGIDFLREVSVNGTVELGDRVAVVGGGNTAMDAVRTAIRLGASEVMCLYRRTRGEMPAADIEVEEAEEEGAIFKFLVAPEEIIAENGKVSAIRLQKMALGEPDASGRRRPVPTGEEEILPVDTVIAAIGQEVVPGALASVGVNKWNNILADDISLMTGIPGVFAGGDCVTGPGIAIAAIAQGKTAARAMNVYLAGQEVTAAHGYLAERTDLTAESFAEVAKDHRRPFPVLEPAVRRDNFRQVTLSMSIEDARAEGHRCLECGCQDYFECKLIDYANQYRVVPDRVAGAQHEEVYRELHPFIHRDSGKCILCGLCVRICEEVMGVTALGLVDRGFDSLVQPEMKSPLLETGCVSCGQCIAVCPTGALVEHNLNIKNVPMDMASIDTVCAFCGMTCEQELNARGSQVIRSVPANNDILCIKGRFGFETYNEERLTSPMVRKDGELAETSWSDALLYAAKKAQSLQVRNGGESLGVFVSPAYTMEEADAAGKFGRMVLGTDKVTSFTRNPARGLTKVLGEGVSTNSLDELKGTDMIFMVGSFNSSQTAAIKIRQAAVNGVKLAVISPEQGLAHDHAALKINSDGSVDIVKEIIASVIEQGLVNSSFVENRVNGFEEFKSAFAGIKVSAEAQQAAAMYGNAKKAMIIVDGSVVVPRAVQLLAGLALITGKVGSPRNGIIVVTPGSNATGILAAGVDACHREVTDEVRQGQIKGAFIFGEDPVGAGVFSQEDLEGMELLVVTSSYMTPTAAIADVVFPGSTPLETSGTYVSSDRRIKSLRRAQPAVSGRENIEVIRGLADVLKVKLAPFKAPEGAVWGDNVKYSQTFSQPDGKAVLMVPDNNTLFEPRVSMDPAIRRFREKVSRLGIC
ncbi:MAG: molybdopterin-dependent oxidoreductase [Syntrophomonadaceae bacterium]|nr:molybdopterin-dependent oxidoreductase [Syntrophomonadaceae bacterium]